MWGFRNGDSREHISDNTTFMSQIWMNILKVFPVPMAHHLSQQLMLILPSTKWQQFAKVPQRIPPILRLNSNKLPHRPFTFLIAFKYQIKTPGCVHQVLCDWLLAFLLAPSAQAPPPPQYISLCLPLRHCMYLNKQRAERQQPTKLRNVLCDGFLTTENGGQPGIPFPSCLVGISCWAVSRAGRNLLWCLRSPSRALLLCILSVNDVCKMGPLSALFNFSVFVKALCQPPQKEMPENFF